MGQWRNGGIARKTIARGTDVTIREVSLEGLHVREQRFNDALCSALFDAACVFDGVHFGGSPASDCDGRSDACNSVAVTRAVRAAASSEMPRPV